MAVALLLSTVNVKQGKWAKANVRGHASGMDHLKKASQEISSHLYFQFKYDWNPKVDTPLFSTTANPLQLYHSPQGENLGF